MQKVKIITDSASDLPLEYFERYNISMLPMGIIIGDKTFLDRTELDTKTFYRLLKESTGELPKTVMPSVEMLDAEFRKNLDGYTHQIYICISSDGSGTFGVANVVKNSIEEELGRLSNIVIIDSRSFSAGYAIVVAEIAKMAFEGCDFDTIMAKYNELSGKTNVLFVVDDLAHLQRGGRVKPSVAFVGGILGIKPLLTIKDGLIDSFGKERGKRRGMEKILDIMLHDVGDGSAVVWVVHSDAEDDAEMLGQMVQSRIMPKDLKVFELGACIGAHTGSGLVGLIYYKE